VLVFFAPAGSGAGRDGLDLLRAGDGAAAEARFRAGLAAESDAQVTGRAGAALRAALWNGVGLALLALDDAPGAADAFDDAALWASDDSVAAVLLYNAGTALATAERWAPARDRLVRALIRRPHHADTRHNLEIVLRHLQTESSTGGERPEPSEFARQLKEEADRLVAERRYADALTLLEDGLLQDSTVAAFNDAIERLRAVTGIVSSDTLGVLAPPAAEAP
jgi:tetratricopeptide (TPR) repeat protein